jgi:rhodanese-related sulfurtransferase
MKTHLKLVSILLICLGFSIHSYGQKNLKQLLEQYNDQGVPYISVQELASSKMNALLLDTREPNEYDVSHLKGALCVGYDDFDIEKFQENHPDKNQEIVVYCSLGVRSEAIGEKLKGVGYTNIKNLYGGIFEWKNYSFEVYNSEQIPTDSIHAYSQAWSKWLRRGIPIFN